MAKDCSLLIQVLAVILLATGLCSVRMKRLHPFRFLSLVCGCVGVCLGVRVFVCVGLCVCVCVWCVPQIKQCKRDQSNNVNLSNGVLLQSSSCQVLKGGAG